MEVKKVDHLTRVQGGRGYLFLDQRATGEGVQEFNTLTCSHCNRVVVLNPQRVRARGYCQKCHAYVCDSIGCNAECNPILQMVELGIKHPDEPWLLRGVDGQPLFNKELKDKTKVY